jgi:hypothetical protein
MNEEKRNNSENDQNKAEEPETAFKTVRIFDSFEEQEKEELKWLASQTPEQHLQHATDLVKRMFDEDLKKHPTVGNHIYFEE